MNKRTQSPSHKTLSRSLALLVSKSCNLQDSTKTMSESEAAEWNKAVNQALQFLVRK